MRVLVTGADGFLGRHLVAALSARGDAVVGVDLRGDPAGLPAGVELRRASVTDGEAMRRVAEGCDAAIHAAAITGLWARDPGDFDRVNAEGTRIVLEAAAAAGVGRAVLVSSYTTLVSGRRGDGEAVLDETAEHAPEALLGPYPASKRRAELLAAEAPLPVAIVLPSAPIGPGDHGPTPPGAMLRDMAEGRLPAMIDCLWNFVDIRAVAAGTVAALELGRAGRRYLLAGEDMDTEALVALFERVSGLRGPTARVPYAVALMAARAEAALAQATGRAPRALLTGVRLAGLRRRFDAARARAELGFAPGPTARAMADALAWMRAAGLVRRTLPGLETAGGGPG